MTIIFEITWKHAAYTYIIWFEQHTKSGNLWPSDLKLHEKMLLNDTHIILFEQPTQSGNIQSHVTIKSEIAWKNAFNDTHIIPFE